MNDDELENILMDIVKEVGVESSFGCIDPNSMEATRADEWFTDCYYELEDFVNDNGMEALETPDGRDMLKRFERDLKKKLDWLIYDENHPYDLEDKKDLNFKDTFKMLDDL